MLGPALAGEEPLSDAALGAPASLTHGRSRGISRMGARERRRGRGGGGPGRTYAPTRAGRFLCLLRGARSGHAPGRGHQIYGKSTFRLGDVRSARRGRTFEGWAKPIPDRSVPSRHVPLRSRARGTRVEQSGVEGRSRRTTRHRVARKRPSLGGNDERSGCWGSRGDRAGSAAGATRTVERRAVGNHPLLP